MINFQLHIRNPFSDKFKNIWGRHWSTPFENKFIELELCRDTTILSISFAASIRQSHSGLEIELGLLGYCIRFNFYDSRHWDWIKNCYYGDR